MLYLTIIIIVFLCWISSVILLRRQRDYFKYMKWFLGITFLAELFGYIVYFVLHQKNNYWVFNAFLSVEVLFLSWFIYKVISPYVKSGNWVFGGVTIFLLLYCYESFGSNFLDMSMKAKNFASLFIITLCLVYYYFLLKDNNYINLKKHPPFWIISGCFFFYFSSIACDFFFDYLQKINTTSIKPVRYVIFIVLNFIEYGCWSYAFLCKYRQTIS